MASGRTRDPEVLMSAMVNLDSTNNAMMKEIQTCFMRAREKFENEFQRTRAKTGASGRLF
jgi:hypothetical protein